MAMSIDVAIEQSISEWIRKEFPLVDIETDWSDNNWHETRFSPTLFVRYFADRLRMVWLSKGSTGSNIWTRAGMKCMLSMLTQSI